MRLFLLENAKAGIVVRAIVCAPDAASSVSSDRAINFVTPGGGKIVLRQAGESVFAVTEDQATRDANDLQASVVTEAENIVSFEVVYSADNDEVPAFSFLDQQQSVSGKATRARIAKPCETRLCDVWSFQANLAALRELETRLRAESVVAALVEDASEITANRYTDELSQVALSLEFTSNLFLPLQVDVSGSMVPCVVHLGATDELGNFAAQIFWREADAVTAGQIQLMDADGEPLLTATIL